MKKLIVSFAFVLIALTSYAQSSSEHLTFKGIPIEGSMTEFCQKLKAKGFTSIGSENNLALFMGDFTGRNATIGVTATDDGKSVFAVAVLLTQVVNGIRLLILITIIKIYTPENMAIRLFQKRRTLPIRIPIQL